MAYGYQATVTVPAPTGGPHTDFTFLLKGTDTKLRLKSLGTGGEIVNSTTRSYSGFTQTVPADLVISTDAAITSLMKWGIDNWDSTNGIIWIWVKIPSYSVGFTIYVSIGNSLVTGYQGGTLGSEFDSNTKVVWHLVDGTSLNAADFTSNGNSGTVTSATATTGKIDGAANLSPSSAKIDKTSATGLPTLKANSWTLSGWHNTSSYTSLGVMFGFGNPDSGSGGKADRYLIQFNNHYYLWGNGDDWDTGVAFDADSAWHHWVFTYDGTNIRFYRDGTLVAGPFAKAWADDTVAEIRSGFATTWNVTITSKLDEERISSTTRLANWVSTEYTNQNNPPSMGAFSSISSGNISYPMMLGIG